MQFCKNCGSPFEGQFCGRCGTPVGQAPGHAAAPPPPPPSYAAPPPPPPSYAAPPPPSYPPVAPAPPAYAPPSPPTRGFWASLFDLSFTSFVAPKIIKFLYVLLMILILLGTLYVVYLGLQAGSMGLVMVIAAPIGAFLYLLLARMWLEVMIVLFRIAENTGDMARNTRR